MSKQDAKRSRLSRLVRWLNRAWRSSLGLSQRMTVYMIVQFFLVVSGVLVVVLGKGKVGLAVGTSVIAAGAAGVSLFGYVLLGERWSARVESLLDAGLRGVWMARSVRIKHEYERRLNAARDCIDLLGFGQRNFREDYIDDFSVWTARGVVIRLILLDPCFPSLEHTYANQRDHEEGSGSIAQDVEVFLREIKARDLHKSEHLSVRLSHCLPSISIFRIDDDMFWGPYLVRRPSRNSPTLLTITGTPLCKELQAHFDDIWRQPSLSIPVNWDEIKSA